MRKINKNILRISLISLLVLLILGSSAFLIYKFRPKADEPSISLHSNISVDPGITNPSTEGVTSSVNFIVTVPELANESTVNSVVKQGGIHISIYLSGKPDGDYMSDPLSAVMINTPIELMKLAPGGGYKYNWVVPVAKPAGSYKYMSKLFRGDNNQYIENSKSEGVLEIREGSNPLACNGACVAKITANPQSVTAGQGIVFKISYHDQGSQDTLFWYHLYVSSTASTDPADADIEECTDLIQNGDTLECTWQTKTGNAAAGGTIDGRHIARVKVFTETGNLMAVANTLVNVTNSEAPNPDTTPEQPTQVLEPNDLGGGLLDFGNPFAAGTLAGKITKFATDTVGVLAFLSFLVAGIIYITSGGDPAKAEKAKKTMLYSIVALVVLVLSYAIINIVIIELNKIFG
jgi:hypothetical protein